jgi:hypothetical protein
MSFIVWTDLHSLILCAQHAKNQGHYQDQSVSVSWVIDIYLLCQLLRNKWMMHSVNRLRRFLIVAQARQVTLKLQKVGKHSDIVWL